jgi:hypothetical protein
MNNEQTPKDTRRVLFYQTGENGEKIPVYDEETPAEESSPTIIEDIGVEQTDGNTSVISTQNGDDNPKDKRRILYSLTDENGNRMPVYDDEKVVSEETPASKSDASTSSFEEQPIEVTNVEMMKSDASEAETVETSAHETPPTNITPEDKPEPISRIIQESNDIQVSQEVESAKTVVQTKTSSVKKPGFGKKLIAILAGAGLVAGGAVVAKNIASDNGPANGEPVAEAPVTPGETENQEETMSEEEAWGYIDAVEAKYGNDSISINENLKNTINMLRNVDVAFAKQQGINDLVLKAAVVANLSVKDLLEQHANDNEFMQDAHKLNEAFAVIEQAAIDSGQYSGIKLSDVDWDTATTKPAHLLALPLYDSSPGSNSSHLIASEMTKGIDFFSHPSTGCDVELGLQKIADFNANDYYPGYNPQVNLVDAQADAQETILKELGKQVKQNPSMVC